ncbi:hypothetical protein MD484_g6595, partial [Candolleomyces efflorescens]
MCPPNTTCTCWFFRPSFTEQQDQFLERHLRALASAFDGDFAEQYMDAVVHEWLNIFLGGDPGRTAEEQFAWLAEARKETVRVQTELLTRYYCNKQGLNRREFAEWLGRGFAENLRGEFPELDTNPTESETSATPPTTSSINTDPDSGASIPTEAVNDTSTP